MAVALGGFAGAAIFVLDQSKATSYLSNDPDTCINCHIMREQHDAWQHSTHHAAATCNDCHVPVDFVGKYATKAVHGYRHSKGFTLQDFHEPIIMKDDSRRVVEANCVRCHEDLTSDIGSHGFASKPGAGDDSMSCTHCHSSVGHAARR